MDLPSGFFLLFFPERYSGVPVWVTLSARTWFLHALNSKARPRRGPQNVGIRRLGLRDTWSFVMPESLQQEDLSISRDRSHRVIPVLLE